MSDIDTTRWVGKGGRGGKGGGRKVPGRWYRMSRKVQGHNSDTLLELRLHCRLRGLPEPEADKPETDRPQKVEPNAVIPKTDKLLKR